MPYVQCFSPIDKLDQNFCFLSDDEAEDDDQVM